MVKVVLDANVWISGIFFKGKLRKILDQWKEGRFELVVSPEIWLELEKKLRIWGKRLSKEDQVSRYLALVKKRAIMVYPREKVNVCEDEDDNKFLEAGKEVKADYLVTGDKGLLKIKRFEGMRVVAPAWWLRYLGKK